MTEAAWESLVSANKKAELKYRNVNPTLNYSIGCAIAKPSKDLIPKRPKPSTLFNILQENYQGYKFLSIPDITFLHQSDHLVTSEFASVDYPQGRVTVFNPQGKEIKTFPPQDRDKDVYLFGITSLANDDLAICTGNGISIWNVEGHQISHFTHDEVENCCHLTQMKSGLLASTCLTEMEGKCVTLWDPRSGKVTSQFGSRPKIIEVNLLKQKQKFLIRNSDIRLPWFITSDSRMNIYISDRNAQCIKVFDTRNRKFIFRFDIGGVDARCRKGSLLPQGIDVDDDDNIFVVDQLTNGVAVFDRHGEYVRHFPLQLENHHCQSWSLALSNRPPPLHLKRNKLISPTRKMAVSYSNRTPRARVYDLSFCRHYSISF